MLTVLGLVMALGNVWGTDYKLVTSASDLVVGDTYIISNSSKYASSAIVMGYNKGENNFPQSTFGEAPCMLTLGGNATSGWYFSYVDDGTTYYLDPTDNTSKNYLKRNTSLTNYGKFAISFNDEACVITSKGKTSRNIIRYNSASNLFSCYSSGQNNIYLYKESSNDARTAVNITNFSATSTNLIKGGTTTTSISNDQNGWTPSYTYKSSNDEVATVNGSGVITAVAKGTATITASLNIANDDATYKPGSTASKTIDITVNNPSHKVSFSVNGKIDGSNDIEEGESITFPAEPSVDVEGFVFQGWITSAIDGTQDNAPSFVNTSTEKMGEEDVTYYAVFATKGESSSEIYTFSIKPSDFNGTGYANNNGSHSITAISDRNNEMHVEYYTKDVMLNSSLIQFKSNSGMLYNKTDLGKIISVVNNCNSGVNFTTYYGTSENPTSGATPSGGFFSIRAGSDTPKTGSIDVKFEIGSVSYSDYCTTVGTPKTLTSISVKTSPKVTYKEGEKFDPTGLVITCNYDDESTKDITYSGSDSNFSFNPELSTALTTSIIEVEVTYKEKTCMLPITVTAIPTYVVTIITPENGTLVVKDGENVINSGDEVKEGTVLTIEVNSAEGYKFRNWQAVDETTHTFTKGTEWTVNADVTIKANFDIIPTCTVNYWVNGDIVSSQTVKDNVTLEFPTTSDINNKKFMGWVTTESVDADNAPTYSTDTTLPNIENGSEVDYFAVFATEAETEGGISYAKATEISEGEKYVIAFDISGQPSNGIDGVDINGATTSENSSDWLVFTAVKKDNGNYYLSYKDKYVRAADGKFELPSVAGASNITEITTNTESDVLGWSFVLCSGKGYNKFYKSSTANDPDYTKFKLWKVTGEITYSDYTTLPQPEFNLTVKAPKYATFYNSKYAIILPLGMKGYIGNYEGGKWNMIEKYGSLDIVPAGVPVIVGGVANDYEMSYKYNNGLEKPSERNDLMGVDKAQTVTAPRGENPDDYYFYALSLNSKKDVNSVGFYWVSANGAPFSLGAHKVYLALPKSDFTSSDAKEFSSFVFDGEATGVEQLFNANTEKADMYNISGQRVNAGYKGIVIMNGKKIVIK